MEICFLFHEKVSIQDAQSCFGSGQVTWLVYPDYFPREFRLRLEAQKHGFLYRLGED
jgi:hypothetical protein